MADAADRDGEVADCVELREQAGRRPRTRRLGHAHRLVGVEREMRSSRCPGPGDRGKRIVEATGVHQGGDQLAPQIDMGGSDGQRAFE